MSTLFERLFKRGGARRLEAERLLRKGDVRAIIVHGDGEVAVNRSSRQMDERLGVSEDEVSEAIEQAYRRKPGRKAGRPIIRKF